MDDVPWDEDVLAISAAAREPELVVVQAQVRRALLAAAAPVARDHPLAHDAVTDREAVHALAELGDRAAPLVAGHEREAHPARIREPAMEHLEVGPADAGDVAAHDDVPRAGCRPLEIHERGFVRTLEENGFHRSTVTPPRLRRAG
jgi:hypothetical protein